MPDIKDDNNLDDFFDKDENSSDFHDDLELGQEKQMEKFEDDSDDNNDDRAEDDFTRDNIKEEGISEQDDETEKGQEQEAEEEWSDIGDTADDEIDKEQENLDEEDDEQEKVQEQPKGESICIAKSKIILAKKLLNNIKENNNRLLEIFSGMVDSKDENLISIGQIADEAFEPNADSVVAGKIIEGVFDGENMIGPDGKQYSVPANYASKSKMVEGDILKLTITGKGVFIYKQISPIERSRIAGVLERNSDGSYSIIADNRKWRILTASVTYFKGEHGDEAIAIIPRTGESKWAAVENIIKKKGNNELGIMN